MKELMVQEPLAGLSELPKPSSTNDRFALVEGFVEIESGCEVSLAVELGQRTMALATIKGYLAVGRRIRGAEWALRDQNSRFSQRYGREAPRVYQNAKRRHNLRVDEFRNAVGVLAAVDVMRANGEDEQEVWEEHMRMQIEVNRASF